MNPFVRPLRSASLAFAAASLVLLLAACQGAGGVPDRGDDTIAVTLAPSLGPTGLSTQGIDADLAISDVLVFVRDASTGGPADEPDCFVFGIEGTVGGVGATTDDCAVSIWDGDSVTPWTVRLPRRDAEGDVIPYDFVLNVRSEDLATSQNETVAFASEAIPELTTDTTLGFEGLTAFLDAALFQTYSPTDLAGCAAADVDTDADAGETVSLFLLPFGSGTGGNICVTGFIAVGAPLVPFADFDIGSATVELDGVNVAATALLSSSKRGLQVEVPSSAAPDQSLSISLPVHGSGPVLVADSDQGADAPLVGAMEDRSLTASAVLTVTEPPVAPTVDPDVAAPELVQGEVLFAPPFIRAYIGGTTDTSEATDFDAYFGVIDALATPGPSGSARDPWDLDDDGTLDSVRIQEYLCYDFTGFESQDVTLTLYATDATGNQSRPFDVTYSVPFDYSGPDPQYCL